MRTKFRIIPVLLSIALLAGFVSCEKKTDDATAKGKLMISVAMSEDLSTLKSEQSDSTINDTIIYSSYQLLLSVTGVNGEIIFEDELFPLYPFGGGYVTEQIRIKAGEFYLEKFMVISPQGKVIFASPLEGSPRAYLVNDPLPLYFSVSPGETTKLSPEVLPVEGFTPSDFGYASFMVQVVKPVTFWVMAVDENPLYMRPSSMIPAKLFVSAPDGWAHDFSLEPMVNKVELRRAEMYWMVAAAEGFEELKFSLSLKEIMASSEANPYVIKFCCPPMHTLILQPGPEEGTDARITNLEPDKNFGDYKYFESTFLSEPILTVMRSTRSLIWFSLNQLPKSATIENVMLTLHYDIPIPWDETVFKSAGPWDSQYPWYGAALQQVISPWEEYKVTWNNQPKTTEFNQVLIYPFIKNANLIELDVTRLFVQDPNTDQVAFENHGMMLRLYPEDKFPGFRFASSDYPEPDMRPKLTIQYSLPVN